MVVEQIREQSNQPEQSPRHHASDQANDDGQQRDRNYAPVGGEVAYFLRARMFVLHAALLCSPCCRAIARSALASRGPAISSSW